MVISSGSGKKKVVHVIGHLDKRIGGPRASLLALIKNNGEHDKIHHEIICQFDTDQEQEDFEREWGKSVYRIKPGISGPCNYWWALGATRKDTTDFFVHIHGIFGIYPILAALFSRLYRVNCVLSPRGMTIRLQSADKTLYLKRFMLKIFKQLMADFGVIHATCDHEMSLLKNQFNGCRLVKESSANFNFGTNAMLDYEPTERPYIIYLGRLSSSKNVDVLINSWLSLSPEDRKDFKLLLVGPIDNQFVFSKIELLGFSKNGIIYKGPEYDMTRKIELLNQSRYLVNFSISENFGHSIFEALCLGIPVAVSRATPWSELEIMGAGIVFDPNEVNFQNILVQILELSDEKLIGSAKAVRSFILNYKISNQLSKAELYESNHA